MPHIKRLESLLSPSFPEHLAIRGQFPRLFRYPGEGVVLLNAHNNGDGSSKGLYHKTFAFESRALENIACLNPKLSGVDRRRFH